MFDPVDIITAIERERPTIVAMVHGETSTGCIQPFDGIGTACRQVDALLVVDAVATIGGVPVKTDEWLLDAVIGGTQKCLSVPSGMSPITYNDRVEAKVLRRKTTERGLREKGSPVSTVKAVASNYFDLGQLQDYRSPKRLNHHTEATTMLYALREGLRIVLQEGLEERFLRHKRHEEALVAGLQAMGLTLYGEPLCKLSVVTCIRIPSGVDGEAVRAMLLNSFGIEIASSFGPLKGQIWRIGTMGFSCNQKNVLHVLGALEATLHWHGVDISVGKASQAALGGICS